MEECSSAGQDQSLYSASSFESGDLMSGIAGIFNLDGSTVDRRQLSKMADAIKGRGPDGIGIWQDGPIGLVHSHFWTTPEELGEEQPIFDGRFCLAADARIDNRSELLPLIKDNRAGHVPSDAELILASFWQWGEESPRHLIGDFAFAIWDSLEQRLFCARDPSGIKLLHYAYTDESLIFGSSVGVVLSALDRIPEANLPFISDLLAGRYNRWVSETAYRDIFRLPPAHYLSSDSQRKVLKQYWIFGEGAAYRLKTDEEYISYYRDLFSEAVRARARSVGPIGLTVSGGLDSSSVACVLDHLISSGVLTASGRIYSSVYNNSPSADEREYLNSLLSNLSNLAAIEITSDDLLGLKEFANDNDFPLEDPEVEILRSVILAQLSQARKDGCRVILSGYGGDQVLGSGVYSVPAMLKDISLQRLRSELPHFRRYTRSIWRLLAFAYVIPIIPQEIKDHVPKEIKSHLFGIDPSQGGLLTPLCVKDSDPRIQPLQSHLNSHCSQQTHIAVTDGMDSVWHVTQDIWAAYAGIDWRYPFYDRRIIDFMLNLPPHLCFRDGMSRYIHRQAMDKMLPEKIRWRTTKAHLGDLQNLGLREKGRSRVLGLIEDSRAVRLGLVDGAKLTQAWKSYWKNSRYPDRPLVRFLCAEAWLRYYEEQSLKLDNM
jgi:asparagine synthase (glutamine-hydrolysing)